MTYPSRSPHIFLVEDNPDDEMLATRALRKHCPEATIEIARDGQEAVDTLLHPDRKGPSPDLVLLDLKLPKLTGVEVLARIRACETMCFLPIVVLTSSDEGNDRLECYRRGVNSYVRKPVDYTTYQEAIQEIVRYWLHWNLHPQPALVP